MGNENRRPCAGTQATLPRPGQCPDPGTVVNGLNPLVSDGNFCPKRLLPLRDDSGNVIGTFMVFSGVGTPQEYVAMTNQPQVAYPALTPAANQSFGLLVISSGTTGTHYRVVPPAVANLYLQTDGSGNWMIGNAPTATVPDPLSIGTINVAIAANISGVLNINGGATGAGIPAGTIQSLLGLSSTGAIVSAAASSVINSRAMYYESTLFPNTANPPPNQQLTAGNNCIFAALPVFPSSDGSSSALNSSIVQINTSGSYEVEWMGSFASPTFYGSLSQGPDFPSVNLVRTVAGPTSSVISYGLRGAPRGNTGNGPCGFDFHCSRVIALNNTDQLSLVLGSGTGAIAYLQDLTMVITRFA